MTVDLTEQEWTPVTEFDHDDEELQIAAIVAHIDAGMQASESRKRQFEIAIAPGEAAAHAAFVLGRIAVKLQAKGYFARAHADTQLLTVARPFPQGSGVQVVGDAEFV